MVQTPSPPLDDSARRAVTSAAAKARKAARKAARSAIGPPERAQEFREYGLDELRLARRSLGADRDTVAYWRRVMVARLATVTAGDTSRRGFVDLRPALQTQGRESARPLDRAGTQPEPTTSYPDLAEIWFRDVDVADVTGTAQLTADLQAAIQRVTEHGDDLTRREASLATEILARYRQDPALALRLLAPPAAGAPAFGR